MGSLNGQPYLGKYTIQHSQLPILHSASSSLFEGRLTNMEPADF